MDKKFNNFFNYSMIFFQTGEWIEYLKPEMLMHKTAKERIKLSIFKALCHMYSIVKLLNYRKISIRK